MSAEPEAEAVAPAAFDTTDFIILFVVAIATVLYFVYRQFSAPTRPSFQPSSKSPPVTNGKAATSTVADNKSAAPSATKPAGYGAGKKSFIEKAKAANAKNHVFLFYGSQTGTAEDLATRFGKDTLALVGDDNTADDGRPLIATTVIDPEDYNMTELAQLPSADELAAEDKNWVCVFFMATYGEGEPTDNVVEFYEWLMKGGGKGEDEGDNEEEDDDLLSEKRLKNLVYLMFGLGNKTYEHFNAMARRIDKRFVKCGAKRVSERGEGDDDASLEEDYLNWKGKALNDLASHLGITQVDAESQKTKRRDAPHAPAFTIIKHGVVTGPADEASNGVVPASKIYWGELTSQKSRRWRRNSLDPFLHSEIIDGKPVPYDVKHPFYGRIATSQALFQKSEDVFDFSSVAGIDLTDPKAKAHRRVTVNGQKVHIERQCYHIELDISGSGLTYQSGDHVGVWPANDEEEVRETAAALKLSSDDLNTVAEFRSSSGGKGDKATGHVPFPAPCTLETALKYYVDLKTPVKQHAFEILGKYAKSPEEKACLFELADNRDLYVSSVEKPQRTLREVLNSFKSVELPVEVALAEILPKVQLRYYSISSSAKEQPDRVGVTAVVVRYAMDITSTVQGESGKKAVVRQGLATSWLERLHESRVESQVTGEEQITNGSGNVAAVSSTVIPRSYLPLYIRTSAFKLPKDQKVPVVMVGPGTGVAPFRGFVRERYFEAKNGISVGPTWLFFGCRHPNKDWLYRDEFQAITKDVEQWKQDGTKTFDFKLVNAFSRFAEAETEGAAVGQTEKKMYVQHRMKQYAKDLWQLLGVQRGYFYICGDARNMAREVHATLLEIARTEGGMASEAEAAAWFKDLKTQGRYQED
ncbi:hypothetical protein HK102_000977, partial [Quaeritorhiza haematococci]